MYLPKPNLKHINSISHEGKVVVFATDTVGNIFYTVKQDGFEDNYLNTPAEQRTGWENWQTLEFPNEIKIDENKTEVPTPDQSVIDKETAELTYQKDTNKFILRSLYQTKDNSAIAPVQLISAFGHIYVFRQSKSNTLLVDRFVLDGMTNKLNRKLEVRFKRSRQKHTPTKNMNKGSNGLVNIDSLDFRDANGNFFYEPTTEICVVNNLYQGWFSVVLVPTIENDIFRWHIFAYNNQTKKVELTTIRASQAGLFDVQDYTIFEELNEALVPGRIPGIIKRNLDIKDVTVTNGLAATKYDLQQEQETQSGEKQLLKTATRLMLVVPTNKGTVALSFAIASDGTLSEIIDNTPEKTEVIRSQQREVLLPLNTLDDIKAIGDRTPPPQGIITGFAEGTNEEDAEDLVKISTDDKAAKLENGDLVKITETIDYQGIYRIESIKDDTFVIDLPSSNGLGFWEKADQEEGGLIFDGMITAYQKTADGKLRITCPNHGLEKGDQVQITGTEDYNNTYPIKKIDDTNFVIERKWAMGETINLKLISQKRRGVVLDGVDDYILTPLKNLSGNAITIEYWFKGSSLQSAVRQQKDTNFIVAGWNGKHILSQDGNSNGGIKVGEQATDGKWHHVAVTWQRNTINGFVSYLDGNVVEKRNSVDVAIPNIDTNVYIGCFNGSQEFTNGQIAEVRIWKTARTAEEIKNNMYLQLTGKEVGLMGYWRLGAIAEGKVVDFSVNSNDGIVHGDAYVSAATLNRKLSGGMDAVKYSNPELFAVSKRATYQESFEFKVNSSTTVNLNYLNNADGKGNKIFTLSYWGKTSRSAEDKKPISALQNNFEDLGNGWYRASCNVTIPDEVSLLRSFEIANVTGNWASLEIRKHRICLLSDAITEARYSQTIPLAGLATQQTNLTNLNAAINLISIQEQQEPVLLAKRKLIQAQLDFIQLRPEEQTQKINDKTAEITRLEQLVTELTQSSNYWQQERNLANWTVTLYEDTNFRGSNLGIGLGARSYLGDWWNDEVSSLKVPNGLRATLYQHKDYQGDSRQFTTDQPSVPGFNDKASSIKVETINGNTDIAAIQSRLDNATAALYDTQQQLNRAKDSLQTLQRQAQSREELEKQRDQLDKELKELQAQLRLNNDAFLKDINTQPTPQIMGEVVKNSKTKGALLSFVNTATRLNAIETCEGNVQLSYFDTQGRMRQTNYDATSDRNNTTFEQWIPDSQRACLNFQDSNSVVKLDNALPLPSDWTIEAWFFYPLPETTAWNTLTRGKDKDHHILVRNRRQLGIYLSDKPLRQDFYDSGFNMELLSQGWHHLTAVGRGDTTLFYIDGQKVGDTKAKALADAEENRRKNPNDSAAKNKVEDLKKADLKVTSDVYAIGNSQGGTQPFGKLAEVRIWDIALSDEEIAVNSKTLLTGNEPGLLAYYPMNEAKGSQVRNHSGNKDYNGTVSAAIWWACTAPIGNPGNTVMKFDGVNNYIDIPSASIPTSNEITISFWAKGGNSLPSQNSIIEAHNAQGNRILNIHLPWDNGRIYWDSGNAQGFDRIEKVADVGDYKGQWVHWAFTKNAQLGEMKIYRNGVLWHSGTGKTKTLTSISKCTLGSGLNPSNSPSNFYNGNIAEVCIWKVARTAAEIQADMYKRLSGKEPNLVAYYPLHEIITEGTSRKVLDLAGNKHGTVNQAMTVDADALVSTEYSTVTLESSTKRKVAIMRRFFAYPDKNGVALLSDKRIEALELKWIGNAQFAPTLLGYIEGPPPVPSENLSIEVDYNGATSVELTMSEDVAFSWTRSQDSGLGGTIDTFIGGGGTMSFLTAPAGIGTSIDTSARVGFKGNFDFSYQFQNESSITSSSSLSMTDKLELRGTPEETAKFPHLGKRFIPKNIGYALVVSALADVFVTRLARSGKMIAYQVQPVENIPPDVNTITFLMNPAYTMNGSLDGMTGSSATSERFFKHVPEMRSQYGSLYPASYYRLQEAYDLKRQIEAEDKERQSYFSNFNVRLVDEISLNRNIDSGDAPTTIGVNREEDKPSTSMTDEEKKKAQDATAEQFKADNKAGSDKTNAAAKAKQAEIQSKIADQDKRVQATESFAGWQKRMEDIQIRAGKHNIVNTYVWDADGGLRTEQQSFANTVEHTIGGSFSMNAGLGVDSSFQVLGVDVELTAQATVNLTQTMNKTEARSRGFELNVDLSGLEYKGISDYNDNPILPGEKVDRYRFMSFYLEGSTQNFQDFFSYVVDPEWLQSNDEEARALRQAQAGKPNKAWRVLHRVTYVERPVLMGFGRDVNKLTAVAETSKIQQIVNKIANLEKKNKKLEQQLDKIIDLLQKK